MLRSFSTLLLLVNLVGQVAAEDWPQFLGPRGDGHSAETNLPNEWSANKNVAWRIEIPGNGWSSPVVVGKKVYLTAAVPEEDGFALKLLSIDARTGKADDPVDIFQEPSGSPKIHSKNSHASPTPLIDGNRIYVHFGHQGTACLDLMGKVIWKNSELQYPPVHGNGGSPLLVADRLIFSCDGAKEPVVVGLDAKSGTVAWKYKRPGDPPKKFAFCTPTLIEVNGHPLVIIPGADSVAALDPKTGNEKWHVRYTGYSVIPRPVYGNGLLYLSTSYDSPSFLAINPDGSGDITETNIVWQVKRGAPHTPSPLLVGNEVYMLADKGVMTCLDAKTGDKIWQERIGGNYSSSPLYADGKIYVQGEDGKGLVIKAGRTFEKLADNGFEERTLASYAIADGAIFVRTDKALYRVQQAR